MTSADAQPNVASRAWCHARALMGTVSCGGSRRTLGFLLFLVLVAGGEGLPVQSRAAQEARATAIESQGVSVSLRLLRAVAVVASVGGQRLQRRSPPRHMPRWMDPTAGGRPPVRAPDAS